jgi:hypothetical protein
VYFPGEQRAELVRDLDEILEDLTNLEHRVTPLYDHTQPASEPDKLADRALAKSFRENPREASLADQAGMRRAIQDPLTNRAFNMDGCATPQPAAKPRPQPLTEEYIKRHSILAADCPGASVVLLASTVRRLAGITTQEPTA